jgi:hypothetical protein
MRVTAEDSPVAPIRNPISDSINIIKCVFEYIFISFLLENLKSFLLKIS